MQRYYKITNEQENHHGFQYVDGLNILKEQFEVDPRISCCAGGLYFTTKEYIHNFYGFGCWVREVFLPTDNPNFVYVKDPSGDKWRANMIILGEKYPLNFETIKRFGFKFGESKFTHREYIQDYLSKHPEELDSYNEIEKFIKTTMYNYLYKDNDLIKDFIAKNGNSIIRKYYLYDHSPRFEEGFDILLFYMRKNNLIDSSIKFDQYWF